LDKAKSLKAKALPLDAGYHYVETK
jgi:hypothetical protein